MKKKTISAAEALELATSALRRAGVPTPDCEIAATHLVTAERRGYPGHGLRRIPGIASVAGQLGTSTKNQIKASKAGFLSVDGAARLGIAAVHDALDDAAAQLGEQAAIVLGLTGYKGTTGSIGVFGSALAERGLVSIMMCSSDYAVAPHGSKRAVLGTNPITISVPGSPTSFCADFATSAWSYGAIRDAADKKQRLPKGVVQTADGKPSTDPNDADNGSQMPMAGHKGYALGLAIELLCGPLLGGKAGRDAVTGSDGFFAVVLRSDAARNAADVNRDAQALYSEILKGPPIDARSPIRIPGQTSMQSSAQATEFSVSAELLDRIRAIGAA